MTINQTKSFDITKRQVWKAYKKVKQNKGSAGVDGVDFEKFESNLENNRLNTPAVQSPLFLITTLSVVTHNINK